MRVGARSVPDIQNRLMAADPLITLNGWAAEALTSVIGQRRTKDEPWGVTFFAQLRTDSSSEVAGGCYGLRPRQPHRVPTMRRSARATRLGSIDS
jgi:hypothetical protein